MASLVCDKGAERIDEYRCLVFRERHARGVDMEDEALATTRSHHAEAGFARTEKRERLPLCRQKVVVADEKMRETFCKRLRRKPRELLAQCLHAPGLRSCCLHLLRLPHDLDIDGGILAPCGADDLQHLGTIGRAGIDDRHKRCCDMVAQMPQDRAFLRHKGKGARLCRAVRADGELLAFRKTRGVGSLRHPYDTGPELERLCYACMFRDREHLRGVLEELVGKRRLRLLAVLVRGPVDDVLDHELRLRAPLPGLVHSLEDNVHGTVVA